MNNVHIYPIKQNKRDLLLYEEKTTVFLRCNQLCGKIVGLYGHQSVMATQSTRGESGSLPIKDKVYGIKGVSGGTRGGEKIPLQPGMAVGRPKGEKIPLSGRCNRTEGKG